MKFCSIDEYGKIEVTDRDLLDAISGGILQSEEALMMSEVNKGACENKTDCTGTINNGPCTNSGKCYF
jgi:hypothetical protein